MPTITLDPNEPVGVAEVAERLDVKDRTVHMWKYRGVLPGADFPTVNRSHAWRWGTIIAWAAATNRLRTSDLVAQWAVLRKEPGLQALYEEFIK